MITDIHVYGVGIEGLPSGWVSSVGEAPCRENSATVINNKSRKRTISGPETAPDSVYTSAYGIPRAFPAEISVQQSTFTASYNNYRDGSESPYVRI